MTWGFMLFLVKKIHPKSIEMGLPELQGACQMAPALDGSFMSYQELCISNALVSQGLLKAFNTCFMLKQTSKNNFYF